jgi:hypothetical protein
MGVPAFIVFLILPKKTALCNAFFQRRRASGGDRGAPSAGGKEKAARSAAGTVPKRICIPFED